MAGSNGLQVGFYRQLGSLRLLVAKVKRKILARKIDILEFIARRKMVWSYELVEKFGYSEKTVPKLLYRLKKAGLIINMTKGCYELTEWGYSKLKYHRNK